jgi:putative FmdB family regulatory protein
MPMYEYYCRTCKTKFEKLQPMSASDQTVACPSGHAGAVRTLSVVARVGGSRSGDFDFESVSASSNSGGCACGGACACGAH